MKKSLLLLASLCVSSVYAEIPYCPGTFVTGGKSDALQHVITQFAEENHCNIGDNCIELFDEVKYSIAWSEDCPDSVAKGNEPRGSTFICEEGLCTPLGFSSPSAAYDE